MSQDDEADIEKFGEAQEPRRAFLRRAAVTVLGAAAGLIGLQRPAGAWQAYCCNLGYTKLCTTSQWNNCSSRWIWHCCGYAGSQLTRISCRECYTYSCSGYAFIGSC